MNLIKKFILNQIIGYVVNKKEVSKMLSKVRDFLSGRKTYLVAFSAILGVIIAWTNGSMSDIETVKAIIEAILAVTIRAGIQKA